MANETSNLGLDIRNGFAGNPAISKWQASQQAPWIDFRDGAGVPVYQIDAAGNRNGIKTYRGLLSQASTTAPTEDAVLDNTIGTIVWTRTSAGLYVGTLAAAFTVGKTFLLIGSVAGGATAGFASIVVTTADTITIKTVDATFTVGDALLSATSVEILVYP